MKWYWCESISLGVWIYTDEDGKQTYELWAQSPLFSVYMPVSFLSGPYAQYLLTDLHDSFVA